ncbi:TIGR04376 family protein [Leptolyngbya ohadii]|uniref:TIGR04376 family protein n=1 Tax=Leptolyngbya ohadii TaxID=1962290 RepID=UPI000B5A197E|nr:TIGR04376 family protein [Leptolyngbya ohadii]
MGLFEDLSSFLESRLEEFLRSNPHLELQALADKLADQESEAVRLLGDLRLREKQIEAEILETAQEIQRWHIRIEKARSANRLDLLKPAEEREAALLRQGNQLWGQMELVKGRIQQTIDLQRQIQVRCQEVKVKLAEAEANRAKAAQQTPKANGTEQQWQTIGWNQGYRSSNSNMGAADPLEQSFRKWEMDEELEKLKREMGR